MGGRGSKPATASPSAAFGRVRISTPKASSSVRNSLRLSGSLKDLGKRALTEKSPLLSGKGDSPKLYALDSTTSEASVGSPPLVVWIGPALICAFCYALYNIFIKKGSATINPILGGVVLQFVAALCGSLLMGFILWKDGGAETLQCDNEGIMWAVFAGMAVGAAEILSFIVSGMGVQSMQSIPIIIGGSVLFGTVMGYTALNEMLTYRGWLGVLLIACGIALVGTDPGGAGSVHG
uniref:EamA domain-containing protein n=1 Tax=Amphora coffeiformis TaxID=265554 RepID=A0A7S3P7P4_9STRA